jgi:RNA polymerase sigma-70 factor (ECF subfamily)
MAYSVYSALFKLVTDEQAMWRVKMEDDSQAFAHLVARWEQPIQRLCTRLTGNSHRGEDLAQETFARLFARRKDYQPSGCFSTFLWRMALNLCYDELRRIKRRAESTLGEEPDDALKPMFAADDPGPDGALAEQERAEAVRHALLALSEPYRVVVVLRHYEGLKFREIAELLQIPEGTVKSRMAEALTQLNRLLHPWIHDAGSAAEPVRSASQEEKQNTNTAICPRKWEWVEHITKRSASCIEASTE